MIKYAKAGDSMVPVLMDPEDVRRLGSRTLSIGSHGYAQMWDGRVKLLHRWVLGLEVGNPLVGDHINRDILDNRRSNLRAVTPTESNLNRDVGTSRWGRGVGPQKSGRMAAMVKRCRVEYHLGTYDSVEEAQEAREEFLMGPLTRERAREMSLRAPHNHYGNESKCRVCTPPRRRGRRGASSAGS
jgi:hypothetical protein